MGGQEMIYRCTNTSCVVVWSTHTHTYTQHYFIDEFESFIVHISSKGLHQV